MDLQFKDWELSLLKKISEAADDLNVEAWLIGGFVRDKLLQRDTKNDFDIVCLGDGIALAGEVAKKFKPFPKVDFYKNFGTAHIKAPSSAGVETKAGEG